MIELKEAQHELRMKDAANDEEYEISDKDFLETIGKGTPGFIRCSFKSGAFHV